MNTEYNEYVTRQSQSPAIVQRWFARRVLKCVVKATGTPLSHMKLLEVGTGLGYLATEAKALGAVEYLGLEPNEQLRQFSSTVAAPFKVWDASLPEIPAEVSGQYNIAVLVHVLEHAADGHQARQWIEALLNNAEPGGQIVIVSPDVLDYAGYFWETDWTHGFPTSNRNVSQIFSDLNSDVVFSQRMRLGSINPILSSLGWWLSKIFPTRLANAFGRKLFGRDVGTGLQVAALWSLTFVVGRRSSN